LKTRVNKNSRYCRGGGETGQNLEWRNWVEKIPRNWGNIGLLNIEKKKKKKKRGKSVRGCILEW